MGANRRKSFDKKSFVLSKGARLGSIAAGQSPAPSYFSLVTVSKKPRPRPWASRPSDTQSPSVCEQAASHWPQSSHASLPLDLMAPSRRYRNLVSAGGQGQGGALAGRVTAQPSYASVLGPVLPLRVAPPCPPPVLCGSALLPLTPVRFETRGAVVHVPRTAPCRMSPQRSPLVSSLGARTRGGEAVHAVPTPVMLPCSDASSSLLDANTEASSSLQGKAYGAPLSYSACYYGEREGQLAILSKRRPMPPRSASSTVCSSSGVAGVLSLSRNHLPPASGSLVDEPSIESKGAASVGTRESKRLVVVCPSACTSVASHGGTAEALSEHEQQQQGSAHTGPRLVGTGEGEGEGGGEWRGLGQAQWVYGHRALRGHKLATSLPQLQLQPLSHTDWEGGLCSEGEGDEEASRGSHSHDSHTGTQEQQRQRQRQGEEEQDCEGPEAAMPFLINNAVLGWKLTTPRRKRRLERLWEAMGEPDQRKPLPLPITQAQPPPLRTALPASRRRPPPLLHVDTPLRPSSTPLRWRGAQGHKQEMQRADAMLQMRVSPSHRPASLNQPLSPTTPHAHHGNHAQQEWDGWGVDDLQLPQSLLSSHGPTTPATGPRPLSAAPVPGSVELGEQEPYLQYLKAKNNPVGPSPSPQPEPPTEPSPKRPWTKLLLKPSTRSPPKHVVTIASVPDSAASLPDSSASVDHSVANDEASHNTTPLDVQGGVTEKEAVIEQPALIETQDVVGVEAVEA